ncbi:sushi, nidogen and EGF-like domain-containing protein 1 [Colius striatus]|uniref:sushi, nidogen and EGF-like domain-containing protein 1 n=1 Tax=Colius striatus TaxID=57412 RepID=UPI002B1E8C92|nr:sushi, nidogen and EGF-like domain-containing protein 1 [Colius striatus]
MGARPRQLKAPLLLLLFLLGLAGLWGPLGTRGAPTGPPAELLYPYGPGVGDAATPHEDDGTSPEIRLWVNFSFYSRSHQSVYVNNNGLLSFGTPVREYTPQPFPLPGPRPFVAPFWADVNTRLGGDVFYRQSRHPQLLARLAKDLAPALAPGEVTPSPSWALVATWHRVPYFGSASDKVNTFQAVLATAGAASFVLLNYGQLQWSSGIANGANAHTGTGGVPAQAGFNSGDDIHYYNIPGSRSPAVLSIAQRSNVGVPGRWIFRVDEFTATEGPPETSSDPPTPTPSPPPTSQQREYVCHW